MSRKAMLAKIHIARKDLALSDESYADILRRKTGMESAAGLSDQQLDRVLGEFKRLGWKPKKGRTGTSKHAQIRMIHAVWKDICGLGIDAEDEAAALRSFTARQTKTLANPAGVADPAWLDSTQANKVLEGLKAWRTRLRRAAAEAA
ncbi:MAG: regulatory protein GemA [Roseococcus sp.]